MTKRIKKTTPPKYRLRLFVAGATSRSLEAVVRVKKLCADDADRWDLEVIDIYQQPKMARQNQIVATPTLVKEYPLPVRRFIGNLVDATGFLVALVGSNAGAIT